MTPVPAPAMPQNISEQLDLLVACAKPASGQNSARVAAGLVRNYIADLIRERDKAITRLSQPSGEEIREACAKVAEDIGHRAEAGMMFDRGIFGDVARAIKQMPLPLSSGSNKSDEGKKGQAG